MKFLFFAFLLFIAFVFLFVFSIFRMLFGGLFGKAGSRRAESRRGSDAAGAPNVSKKIISSDEGEYVDYVEIKD
jgi:hypothetical protein